MTHWSFFTLYPHLQYLIVLLISVVMVFSRASISVLIYSCFSSFSVSANRSQEQQVSSHRQIHFPPLNLEHKFTLNTYLAMGNMRKLKNKSEILKCRLTKTRKIVYNMDLK